MFFKMVNYPVSKLTALYINEFYDTILFMYNIRSSLYKRAVIILCYISYKKPRCNPPNYNVVFSDYVQALLSPICFPKHYKVNI